MTKQNKQQSHSDAAKRMGDDAPLRGGFFGRFRLTPELIIGPLASLWLHVIFLLVAAWMIIQPPIASDPGAEVAIEFATLTREQLTELDEIPFEVDSSVVEVSKVETTDQEFEADTQTDVVFDTAPSIDIQELGGAGDASESDMDMGAGGVGGTTFFGIESRGRRFLYVVDVSASMRKQNRLVILKEQLIESISVLPDYTSFSVIAYNGHDIPMSKDNKWKRATDQNTFLARAWIKEREATGSTDPTSSFLRAFEFKPRADVIYFMTDAENLDGMAEFVADLNKGVRKTVIHTIAFGDSGSEEIMRQIARESGGTYRYVSLENGG